jgi:DNA-binding GntR family transcriptional regulator
MMAGLRSSIEAYTRAGAARLDAWQVVAERLRSEHRRIVAAMSAGDAAAAREAVRAHITDYYTEVAQALSPADAAEPAVADAARAALRSVPSA